MSHERFDLEHHAKEHWLLHLIDQQSLRRWFSLWVGTVRVSALFYWTASGHLDGNGIRSTIQGRMDAPVSFSTALYFSCVTTTTLGYGDFAPEGFARILTILQAFLGMVFVGIIISKILTRHQEQMILDTNRIALAERSASVLTALNAQLFEFQEIGISHEQSGKNISNDGRLLRRWENAELRFSFLLESIHQLLRASDIQASTKSKILKALRNTVVEFVAACEKCDSSNEESSSAALLGICGCPMVGKDLGDDKSVAEILGCLNGFNRNTDEGLT